MHFMPPRILAASRVLTVVSFAFCLLVVIVDAGIANTPYETTDSAGHRMGFNDPLSLQHWRIIAGNFRIAALLSPPFAYGSFLLCMHALGLWVLLNSHRVSVRAFRWFFGLQGALFPLGWIGWIFLPSTLWAVVQGRMDREGIIDVPFIAFTAQPVWIAASLLILAASRIRQTPIPATRDIAPGPGI